MESFQGCMKLIPRISPPILGSSLNSICGAPMYQQLTITRNRLMTILQRITALVIATKQGFNFLIKKESPEQSNDEWGPLNEKV